jgi:type VI protein secretion system component Hcp
MGGDTRHDNVPNRGRPWRHLRASWRVVVPTLAALGFGVGGAVAIGSVGSNGTITGCYLTPAGASESTTPVGSLRVIDPSDTTDSNPAFTACTGGEAQISWAQTGPQGPSGQNGENGQNGLPGQQGTQGPAGPQGPAGGVSAQSGPGADILMELNPSHTNLGNLQSVPEGETQVKSSQDQIFDLTSFDLGASSPATIRSASSGAGAGQATFQKFVITKQVDKYSSALFVDLVKGTVLKSAEIIVRRPTGTGKANPLAQYVMTEVRITDVHVSGSGRIVTETVQGEYGAIQFVIYEQMPDGTTKVGSAGGWNQVQNHPVSIPVVGSLTSRRHRHR